jgi:hypothetical protein
MQPSFRMGRSFIMFLKDETPKPVPQKNIRIATSAKLTGDYSSPTAPVTGNYWAEGPTAIKIGNTGSFILINTVTINTEQFLQLILLTGRIYPTRSVFPKEPAMVRSLPSPKKNSQLFSISNPSVYLCVSVSLCKNLR